MPAAPIWLLLLLPWAALVVYLLMGSRQRVAVPFLPLWRLEKLPPRPRKFSLPPPAIACALLAILLAILAAARPVIPGYTRWHTVMIVDRGFTMPEPLQPPDVLHPDEVQGVPETPTPIDTRPLLALAVDRALANLGNLVLLYSNQDIDRQASRLIQIVPAPVEEVGMTDLKIRAAPHPQAMVRIRNDSDARQISLRISGASPVTIDLPPRGQEKTYFVDLLAAPAVVEAQLSPAGAISAADIFWAVRRQSWPRLEIRSPLDPAIQRIASVYQRHRPTSDNSQLLPITASDTSGPCVLLPAPAALKRTVTGALTVEPSPITDGVDFSQLAFNCTAAELPPDDDWNTLIRCGGHPLVAVATTPSRKVWIGFHCPQWSSTPDFVVFWTKVFDWAGQGADVYSWRSVHLPDFPKPGLYASGQTRMAVNAPAVPLHPPPATDWRRQLASAQAAIPPGAADASRWLLIAAIVFLTMAAAIWPRKA
ncbi:MAG TPA: hypothetical protein VMD30_02075 [Tepidisphaeraceae bacterium]|nr:hypothetical protein [Tepidisphaeraceae bacterium]